MTFRAILSSLQSVILMICVKVKSSLEFYPSFKLGLGSLNITERREL